MWVYIERVYNTNQSHHSNALMLCMQNTMHSSVVPYCKVICCCQCDLLISHHCFTARPLIWDTFHELALALIIKELNSSEVEDAIACVLAI